MGLTVDQVLSLAPDGAAADAGQGLAARDRWTAPGSSADALWGECRGSALYKVRVALSDLAAKCSCPSRKHPCKHALGLLLLFAAQPDALPVAEPPPWVVEWLGARADAAARKQERQSRQGDAVADPEAQAKRAEQRLDRVLAGLALLDRWLDDLIKEGLASLEERPVGFVDGMAARLVDAQAPGFARQLRYIAQLVGAGPGWPERALEQLGLLALASRAFQRLDRLEPALRADLRQLAGFTLEKPEVVAAGDLVDDDWFVLGQQVTEDERLRSQRSWLRGQRSKRLALVLQFAPGRASFPEPVAPGSTLEATLAFWPSAMPQRALLHERRSVRAGLPEGAAFPSIDALFDDVAGKLAKQPWLERFGAVLGQVVPLAEAEGFRLRDQAGAAVPLAGEAHWKLLALSGGAPVDVCGEWNGRAFLPLAAIAGGEYHLLREEM